MSRYAQLLIEAIFVDNLALTFFLGMCTFLAVSRKLQTALGVGVAVVVVQAITVPVNQMIHHHVLQPGAWSWIGRPDMDLRFLDLIVYIGVIAAMVQILEMFLERYAPALHRTLGIYLPLVTVNCAILGGSLFATRRHLDPGESVVYGIGSGLGWALAIVALAGIRERLRYSDPPAPLRGLGLTFIVVGLMALGFLAYSGLHVG